MYMRWFRARLALALLSGSFIVAQSLFTSPSQTSKETFFIGIAAGLVAVGSMFSFMFEFYKKKQWTLFSICFAAVLAISVTLQLQGSHSVLNWVQLSLIALMVTNVMLAGRQSTR